MILYIYIAPGQGQITPWWQNFNVNRKALSPCPFVASLKKKLLEVWFYTHFKMMLYMYIAPEQGQTTPWGQNYDVNRKALSLCPFVASLIKTLWSLILYIFFILLYMYIAPEQGQTTPWGQNYDVNRKALSLCPFVASLIKTLWSLILYIFFILLYMYIAPEQGQTTPWGKIMMPTERHYHFAHLLQV